DTMFHVPDLRGRFPMGADDDHLIGHFGGTFTKDIDVVNLPAHSHDATVVDAGHVHSEVAAVPTIINGGLEAPAPAATPSPSVTGLAFTGITVSVGNTGGSETPAGAQPHLAIKGYMRAL